MSSCECSFCHWVQYFEFDLLAWCGLIVEVFLRLDFKRSYFPPCDSCCIFAFALPLKCVCIQSFPKNVKICFANIRLLGFGHTIKTIPKRTKFFSPERSPQAMAALEEGEQRPEDLRQQSFSLLSPREHRTHHILLPEIYSRILHMPNPVCRNRS